MIRAESPSLTCVRNSPNLTWIQVTQRPMPTCEERNNLMYTVGRIRLPSVCEWGQRGLTVWARDVCQSLSIHWCTTCRRLASGPGKLTSRSMNSFYQGHCDASRRFSSNVYLHSEHSLSDDIMIAITCDAFFAWHFPRLCFKQIQHLGLRVGRVYVGVS
jgi:hypothetical protein